MLDLFDKFGRISIPTPEAIAEANLTDKQTEALVLVIDATQARQDSEVRAKLCSDAVREAMRVESDCIEANNRANPPPDRISALRMAQEAYRSSH